MTNGTPGNVLPKYPNLFMPCSRTDNLIDNSSLKTNIIKDEAMIKS